MTPVRVGLPDSGIDPSLQESIEEQQRFVLDGDGAVTMRPHRGDASGHGTALARIIAATAPRACILSAEVFDAQVPAAPTVVAAGLAWLVERGAVIVNMSFGLLADRKVLRAACSEALQAGVVLVAAAPASGATVYPAAYAGVVRVTGDARCAAGELSLLDDGRVDFGACPGPMGHIPHQTGAGSSLAAAHVTGQLADYLDGGGDTRSATSWLRGRCKYVGRERRT